MGIRFLHITLAFFLFVSTTGLTINSHFCTGKYKYCTLFVEPANCCAKVQGHYPTEGSCEDEVNQTPCCQNKASFHKSNYPQNFTADSSQEVTFPTLKVIISSFHSLGKLNYQRLDIDYLNYKPPLIKEDFSILFQVFRC